MNIPTEISYPVILSAIGGVAVWVKSVEDRLTTAQAVIEKIDQLVTLILEDRLDKSDLHFTPKRPQAR